MVSDLNKNFGGSTDLAKKRHGSADLHTPTHPPFQGQNGKLSLNVLLLALYFVTPGQLSLELFASSRILISDIIVLVSFSPETP